MYLIEGKKDATKLAGKIKKKGISPALLYLALSEKERRQSHYVTWLSICITCITCDLLHWLAHDCNTLCRELDAIQEQMWIKIIILLAFSLAARRNKCSAVCVDPSSKECKDLYLRHVIAAMYFSLARQHTINVVCSFIFTTCTNSHVSGHSVTREKLQEGAGEEEGSCGVHQISLLIASLFLSSFIASQWMRSNWVTDTA